MRSLQALRWLPFAVMLSVALIDLLAGPSLVFLPLLTLGPAFASVSGGVRRTAMVGAVALAICVPLAYYNGLLSNWQNYLTVISILGVTAASMLAARLRLERERELANVRQVAEAAQRVLLRPVPRRAGDLRVALSYTSAAAEAQIGGDLYEVVTTPHGVRLLIGDVQGKGLGAVETAAWVLGAFREAAYDEADLGDIGERLEVSLARHLGGEQFVTAIVAEVHDGEIELVHFGHPPPLLIRGGRTIKELEAAPRPPLGIRPACRRALSPLTMRQSVTGSVGVGDTRPGRSQRVCSCSWQAVAHHGFPYERCMGVDNILQRSWQSVTCGLWAEAGVVSEAGACPCPRRGRWCRHGLRGPRRGRPCRTG